MHVCWLETQANLWEYKLKGKPHGTINTASTQLKVLLQKDHLAVNPTPSYNLCHKYFFFFFLLLLFLLYLNTKQPHGSEILTELPDVQQQR